MSADNVPTDGRGSSADGEQYRSKFDRFFAEAEPAVLVGGHTADEPPAAGSPRWPVTVIGALPDQVEAVLDDLTRQAVQLAGTDHFQTGRRGSSHLTVRSLEYFRPSAAPDDPQVSDYLAAMRRTATTVSPVRLTLTGVTLTITGVMAQLEPDDGFWDLQRTLCTELGVAGWRESGWERDLAYVSLLHFAGPIADPAGLVEWVRDRRSLNPMTFELAALMLVRYDHRESTDRAGRVRQMARSTWHEMPFARPESSC